MKRERKLVDFVCFIPSLKPDDGTVVKDMKFLTLKFKIGKSVEIVNEQMLKT